MDYKHSIVQSVYRAARKQLCNVDKLADVVLFAASASQDNDACSHTARLGFEALTGGHDMIAGVQPVFFMGSGMPLKPDNTTVPSVTYISLTGDSDDLFADNDGHRFLVLQCHNHVRVIQACKGTYGYTVGCWTLYMRSRSAVHGTGCVRCCVGPLYNTTLLFVHIGNWYTRPSHWWLITMASSGTGITHLHIKHWMQWWYPLGMDCFACCTLAGCSTSWHPLIGMTRLRMISAHAMACLHLRHVIAKCASDLASVRCPKMLQRTSLGRSSICNPYIDHSLVLMLISYVDDAGECTAADFVTTGKYSFAAATMTYETFASWWEKLVDALRTPMPIPVYNPNDVSGESLGQDERAKAVEKVLGVPYGGKVDASWFYQKAVQF